MAPRLSLKSETCKQVIRANRTGNSTTMLAVLQLIPNLQIPILWHAWLISPYDTSIIAKLITQLVRIKHPQN